MAEAAARHCVGRLLEVPLGVRERRVRGQVIADRLVVRVLALPERALILYEREGTAPWPVCGR